MNKSIKKLVPKLRFPEFRNAGEWDETQLNKLGELVSGLTYSPEDVRGSGLLVLRSSNVQNGEITLDDNVYVRGDIKGANLSKPNDILICVRNGSKALIGKNAMIPEGMPLCTHGAFMTVFRATAAKFVFQLFQSAAYQKQVDADLGATINSINGSQFLKYKFFVPLPEEQQKIANCLTSIDDLISAQSQKVEALKTHKKGLMQQLFPREGETVPRLRFPEFRDAGEWDADTLVRLAKFRRGSFPQPYGLPEWYDSENGMPFVQVFDVDENLRLKDRTKNMISKLGAEQSVFIAKGTLIVTLQGSIGRVAISQYDAYIDRTLLIFEEFYKPTEKLFFAYVIQSLFEIEKEKAPGGIIKTITKESLSSFVVKLPCHPEQQKIADCLSSIDDLITAQTKKLESLKEYKRGLMQQLFPVMDETKE